MNSLRRMWTYWTMLPSQLFGNISEKANFSSIRINAPFTYRGLHRRGLTKMGVQKLGSASQSPDLNPIEHLWDKLVHRLRSQPILPSSLQALTSAVMDACKTIPMVTYQKLVESLHKRVKAVMHAKGEPTSY
ncbi:QLQ domain-containing protein [Trichonephila clavipes]|nr:QLQ domain-containing protein [Trichonephila clavipes]